MDPRGNYERVGCGDQIEGNGGEIVHLFSLDAAGDLGFELAAVNELETGTRLQYEAGGIGCLRECGIDIEAARILRQDDGWFDELPDDLFDLGTAGGLIIVGLHGLTIGLSGDC